MGDRVGVELLYNAVKTEVEAVGSGRGSWQLSFGQRVRVPVETRCGRESHTRPKGPGAQMS